MFGCGNKDWTQTYQRIPKLVHSTFEQHGGKSLLERGEGDASSATFFESFDAWEAKLWEVLPQVTISLNSFSRKSKLASQEYNTVINKELLDGLEVHDVDEGTARATDLRQLDAALGVVVDNRLLTAPGAPEKRHIGELRGRSKRMLSHWCTEFALPSGMTSRAGDYLAMCV